MKTPLIRFRYSMHSGLVSQTKNNEIITHVSDGKKIVKATGKILKKQKIKVAGKSYDTLLVEPEIEGCERGFLKKPVIRS